MKQSILPKKLIKGDEVRVIAPSRSLKVVSKEDIAYAQSVLESLDLKVSYLAHLQCKKVFIIA